MVFKKWFLCPTTHQAVQPYWITCGIQFVCTISCVIDRRYPYIRIQCLMEPSHSMLLFVFLLLVICRKFLCIVALKLLYTLFVRDMGYNRWNTQINVLFSWLPLLKILSRKICRSLVLTGHDQFLCVICERATYKANIMENIHRV